MTNVQEFVAKLNYFPKIVHDSEISNFGGDGPYTYNSSRYLPMPNDNKLKFACVESEKFNMSSFNFYKPTNDSTTESRNLLKNLPTYSH